MKKNYNYLILFLIILIILIIIFLRCNSNRKCNNKDDNGIIIKNIDLNYHFINTFINNELEYIRNNNLVTKFIDNPEITNFFIKEIKKILGDEFFIADRKLFLRYYNSQKFINPYENWHFDKKRFSLNTYQYRGVLNLFDDSSSQFCYKLKCQNNEEKCIISKKNTLILIEANNCLHKVHIEHGERLVLIVDVVNNSKKGICGRVFSILDYIWLKIIVNNFYGSVEG